jgi:hypothetical protein
MNTPGDLAQKMAAKPDQELLAMFASPDDWTPEALDCAKVELRKRGLDSPGERPPADRPPDAEEGDDRPDIYEFFGTYSNEEARLLLDAFVNEGVGFSLDMDKMGIADMAAFQAADGGTFGAGVGVAIGVHTDDCDRAMEIRQRVFKIMLCNRRHFQRGVAMTFSLHNRVAHEESSNSSKAQGRGDPGGLCQIGGSGIHRPAFLPLHLGFDGPEYGSVSSLDGVPSPRQ